MKSYTILAFVLINIGIAAFANQGISYTMNENVINLTSVQQTMENNRTLPLLPIVGGICLVVGISLLLLGRRKD
jgi:hypothetical protein